MAQFPSNTNRGQINLPLTEMRLFRHKKGVSSLKHIRHYFSDSISVTSRDFRVG